MGAVWLAQHVSLDTTCAIKFIHDEAADRPEARARFEREAKASAQLRSENVVQILDYGISEDGLPYIAMEHLVGEPLSDRLKRLGRLSPVDTYRVISGVARALAKAHGAGIVHRDLKPDNVFICRDEDREIAKVLDFGIAKHKGLEINGSSTRTGALLGTPFYMSPEQAQGVKSVDGRADLWSLAVVTFRCLTGELPFRSEALGDLLMKIMTWPIPVPSHVARGLPEGFDRWFERAMQRDPDRRFQTAREFSDALGLALGVSQPTYGVTPMPDAMAQRAAQPLGQTRVGTASDLRLAPEPALPFGAPGAAHAGVAPQPVGSPPGYPGYPVAAPAQVPGAAAGLSGRTPYPYAPQPVQAEVFAPGGTAYGAESPFNQPGAPGYAPSPAAAAPTPFDQTSSGLRPLPSGPSGASGPPGPHTPELSAGAHALGGPSMSGLEAPAYPARASKGKGPLVAVLAVVVLGGGGLAAFLALRGTSSTEPASAASESASTAPTTTAGASATSSAPAPSASAVAPPDASASSVAESTSSTPSAVASASPGPTGSARARGTGRVPPSTAAKSTEAAVPPPPPPPPPTVKPPPDTLGF
ncbi:MAG: protein kinase [Myxococcales bacterium]|nr:protein kinase [Myxococcales bacterium]